MSTAKSMATSYLNGKRQNNNSKITPTRFKSSTSNLATTNGKLQAPRLKSTSMTNLAADQEATSTSLSANPSGSRIQRPVSRNALDSIHNGMNAKYAQVQSKVLLQNIRPQNVGAAPTRIPAASKSSTLQDGRRHVAGRATPATAAQSDRLALQNKLKALEEELAKAEAEREQLKQEIERERLDKSEQVNQLKLELQEKLAEHDKHNEEYHQKLLEAYELADQNRRAADSVLAESRQRDEESRKKVEELEGQLNELKEFVAMKEEMTGKMFELREQIRDERQRYEEQLKSLHQVFENEKISSTHVGELASQQKAGYFDRQKPSLASCESINKLRATNCQRCLSGASQLHRSEQDMYGSKMSTRMQESARSAWRASKQFASSVITGGVGLSACRQCKKRTSSMSSARAAAPAQRANSQQVEQLEQLAAPLDEQHTSVVEVGGPGRAAQQRQEEQSNAQVQPGKTLAEDTSAAGLIRVDGNNKLTIVTKFNEECQPTEGPSSGSERSRCESSSSGRGTSSDAGSAASQNGDEGEPASSLPSPGSQQKEQVVGTDATKKKQRRKSSLFKASKVFGGSQASLSKLKNLFTGRSTDLPSALPDAEDRLENARLRCQEQNEASKTPNQRLSAGDKVTQDGQGGHVKEADEPQVERALQQQVALAS